jgi:hypothetical protein
MVYLDDESRTAMKADLASFYGDAKTHVAAIRDAVKPEQSAIQGVTRYRRRSSRSPY